MANGKMINGTTRSHEFESFWARALIGNTTINERMMKKKNGRSFKANERDREHFHEHMLRNLMASVATKRINEKKVSGEGKKTRRNNEEIGSKMNGSIRRTEQLEVLLSTVAMR